MQQQKGLEGNILNMHSSFLWITRLYIILDYVAVAVLFMGGDVEVKKDKEQPERENSSG